MFLPFLFYLKYAFGKTISNRIVSFSLKAEIVP